jgi:hypothetical protein
MPKIKLSKDAVVEGKKYKAGDTVNCTKHTANHLRTLGMVDTGKKATK